MMEENKKENIKDELDAAEKAFLEAELLAKNDFLKGAVSRLYYSILYRTRAVLLTKGLEPKSHEAALRLFSLHFVKGGIFETKSSHLFSKLMKYREEADYNPAYLFTLEDFTALRTEANELSGQISTYLKDSGYL